MQHTAPNGTYTEEGDSSPRQCPAGTYNLDSGQSVCPDCPEGYYCDLPGTSVLQQCPAGSYCPSGSDAPIPCPEGTFSSTAQLSNVTQCSPCTPGKYCDAAGLQTPTDDCLAGYFCAGGDDSATPVTVCPAGHYCQVGTHTPEPCPIGTFAAATDGKDVSHCQQCSGGKFCSSAGLSTPTGDCDGGWYCSGGASSSQPNDATGDECTVGHQCPAGSVAPVDCADGTYAATPGLATCTPCPEGNFCETPWIAPTPCPAGSYCTTNSGPDYPDCPAGTYSATGGKANLVDCQDCDANKYCAGPGNTAPTGDCEAGFECVAKCADAQCSNADGTGGACPQGSFCLEGTPAQLCPVGTYGASSGYVDVFRSLSFWEFSDALD